MEEIKNNNATHNNNNKNNKTNWINSSKIIFEKKSTLKYDGKLHKRRSYSIQYPLTILECVRKFFSM